MIDLPTVYTQFIHRSRYARWLPDKGRRETWAETVDRFVDYCEARVGAFPIFNRDVIRSAIFNLDVMPSMRVLMTAGPALDNCAVCAFNCAYLPVDDPRAFDETLYILMCGTGVGFSVERQVVARLPEVSESFAETSIVIVVEDSKEGWAEAYQELIALIYVGRVPSWDTSKLRPAGAKLKTFGGRSSGPEPLKDLFRFTVEVFREASGRKLTSIECHDLMCKIGEVVVVGGVRRSALISLSNPSDERMRDAKIGSWWETAPWRALANNSAAWTEKPDPGRFMREWLSIYESRSGERGIFNREAARRKVESLGDRRDPDHEWGCNPCSEIILRPNQFCNLTEIVLRPEDTVESITRKAEIATVLGTVQATFTDFRHLRSRWRQATEEEALLGVSMTGIMDHPALSNPGVLTEVTLDSYRSVVVRTNELAAKALGISPAAATTCVKPSGTVSQLVTAPAGIHENFSPYYIRRVRADAKDPIARFMIDKGIPWEPDVTKSNDVVVFEFPQKSPMQSRTGRPAIEQLELWLTWARGWCEHKPSCTIHVAEDEWPAVGAWIYDHFDEVSGISFLPRTGHTYRQAPYEEIDAEEYERRVAEMPETLDWDDLRDYESDDETIGSQEFACTADHCEVVDLIK